MTRVSVRLTIVVACAMLFLHLGGTAQASTLCVNSKGVHDCFATIQAAVNHAMAGDTINVAPGTYKEQVTIGTPLSLIGADADNTVIDATNLAHGVFVDGVDNPGLHNVTVAQFTVRNALFEGILVVSASDVAIRDNHILNNDATPNLNFTGAPAGCLGPDDVTPQPGTGTYENDETGDCGGALHLVGTSHSVVSGNLVTGNADGLLISDETAESHHNLVTHNVFKDNPLECGIVLASHPPAGHTAPPFAPHFGVDHNTVTENVSTANGVKIGGAGAGMFSDGNGKGRVSGNLIIHNTLTDNGLGGVALHTHVGPAFFLPADDMSGNVIVGNFIAGNLADQADTATPGRVGININSGGGGSPVLGTIISGNTILDEDVDIAINTPAAVDIQSNDLLGGKIGVADVCVFDGASVCTGTIDATQNYWGCAAGPGGKDCTTASGADVLFTPFLLKPVRDGEDRDEELTSTKPRDF